MKPIFAYARCLFVPLAFSFFATVAPVAAEDTTVELAVKVEDEGGHAVSMARVNIYEGFFSGRIVVPPMLQDDTNASGLVRFKIPVARGQTPKFSIEVGREDMQSEIRPIDPGPHFVIHMLEKFSLKPRPKVGGTGDKEVITVGIDVQNENFDFLEGARVVISPSGGLGSERYIGVTNGEGRATIPVWWASASPELAFGVDVSKEGYRDKRITIQLNKQQVGKTIRGAGVALETIGAGTIKTTVTVRNKKNKQPVGDATVVLDGGSGAYYSDKTNGGGNVTFYVSKPGGLAVRISQDNYFPFTGEARLLKDQPEIPLEFLLEPKANKDQGDDTIEVTVLGKDLTNEKSTTSRIPGAFVKAGSIGVATDSDGVATLIASFEENQEVIVQANGYKTQTRNVRLHKNLHMFSGSGKATFTLEPELSDNSPIRLSVEVRDESGKAVPKAHVDIETAGGEYLTGAPADDSGNFSFNSSEFEQDISVLRKGLVIDVKARGYKEVGHRSIPADMLKPSTKMGEFLVQLERDWSELEKDLAALEARVKAWSAERFAGVSNAGQDAFIDKALTTRKHAEQTGKEIEAAKEAFGIVTNPGGVTLTRCKKAAELKQDIELCEAEANQKAEEIKRLLDAASTTAELCADAHAAEVIRANYKDAIKLIGQVGVRNKKADKDRDQLLKLAQESAASTKLLAELDAKLASIGEDKKTAEDNATKAAEQYGRISDSVKGSNAKRNELYSDFATLKDKYHVNEVAPPAPIQTRLDAIENTLNPRNNLSNEGSKPKQVPESVASAAGVIEGVQGQAEKFIARYRAGGCDIDTMDEVVDGINTTLTNATGEIGMAGDIMSKATACENKFKDEVEVPDLTPLDDLGAMASAADQAGMKFHAAATSATPPPKSQRLFGPQDPPAKSKAHRGDSLTILVYQKLAEKNATPTPPPIVVSSATPSPSPSPDSDEIVVPDVSKFKDPDAMLAGAGPDMVGMLIAVRNAPPPGTTSLYSHQDPAANTKSKRGKPLIIYIYQSLAEASPSPSGTPGAATANARIMPNLDKLTLEQAIALLPAGVRIGSDEIGDKPPKNHPEKALTIFHQYPPAGEAVSPGTAVTINRYGEAESTVAVSTPEPTPDSQPDSSPKSGPTDISNTTGGEFWKTRVHGAVVATPRPKKPTPAPARKKSHMSDWWRQHGHDRPDYEVPDN